MKGFLAVVTFFLWLGVAGGVENQTIKPIWFLLMSFGILIVLCFYGWKQYQKGD